MLSRHDAAVDCRGLWPPGEMLAGSFTERLLALGCIDAAEPDSLLLLVSGQAGERVAVGNAYDSALDLGGEGLRGDYRRARAVRGISDLG